MDISGLSLRRLERLAHVDPPAIDLAQLWGRMSGVGVRRAKAAFFSGCKSHPTMLKPEATGAVMGSRLNVRFGLIYVCSTPISRHSEAHAGLPLLTQAV